MRIKDKFIKKIYIELQQYKELYGNKEVEVNSKLKTCIYIYETLISSADEFSDMLLMNLVNQSTSILESIYEEFENVSDTKDFYSNIKSYVEKIACCTENEMDEKEYTWWDNTAYDEGGF